MMVNSNGGILERQTQTDRKIDRLKEKTWERKMDKGTRKEGRVGKIKYKKKVD